MALFQQTTTIIKLDLCVDLWMCEITYLFAYAISAAAMVGLVKYETKQII